MSTLRMSFFGLAIGLGLTIGGISIPAVHAGPSLMDKDPMTAAVSAVLAELDERSRASVAVQSGALMERVRPEGEPHPYSSEREAGVAAELGLPLREVQEVCTLEPGASLVSGIVGLRSDAEASATIHVVERTTLGSGVRTYMVTLHARGGAWVPQPLELPARAYGPC